MEKPLNTKFNKHTVKRIKNVSQNMRKKTSKKKIHYVKINPKKCVYTFTKFFLKISKKKFYRVCTPYKEITPFTSIDFFAWLRVLTIKPNALSSFGQQNLNFIKFRYLIFILSAVFFQRILLRLNILLKLKEKFFSGISSFNLAPITDTLCFYSLGRLKSRYGFTSKLKKKKFIFLKLKKLILEQKLHSALFRTVFVNLKRICNQMNPKFSLVTPKTSRMWWVSYLFYFKDLINILYFSAYFSNSRLITSFIARNIVNKKNHYRFLRSIQRIIKYFFWFERAPGFYGICIKVRGKFHGILRKRKFHLRLGRTRLHTLQTRVDCSYEQSFTRFGVFSIKTWLLYYK